MDPIAQANQRSGLVARRARVYELLALVGDPMDAASADAHVEATVKELAGESGLTEAELRVVVATQAAEAGMVDDADDWLGERLAGFLGDYDGFGDESVRLTAEVVAYQPGVAVAFFATLGAGDTAALAHRVEHADGTHRRSHRVSVSTRLFGAGLAAATRTGDVGFTGDELISAAAGQLGPGGGVVNPAYLFTTGASFDEEFLLAATVAELRVRETNPAQGTDQPIADMLDEVVAKGPESTARLVQGLGDDVQVLFRPDLPITDYDLGDGSGEHVVGRVFESLGQSRSHRGTLPEFLIYHAGESNEPLAPYVADIVGESLAENLPALAAEDAFGINQMFPDSKKPLHVAGLDVERAVNAAAAVYLGGNPNLVAAEQGYLVGAARAAADGSLTNDGAHAVGVSHGILLEGRHHALAVTARDADEAAELRAMIVGVTLETGLGYFVAGGKAAEAALGAGIDVGVGEFTDRLFYADHELDVAYDNSDEKSRLDLRLTHTAARVLHDNGQLELADQTGPFAYDSIDDAITDLEPTATGDDATGPHHRPGKQLLVVTPGADPLDLEQWTRQSGLKIVLDQGTAHVDAPIDNRPKVCGP